MSRAYDDVTDLRRDAHVAQALGISLDTLNDYPFEIDANASDDGLIYSWHILWDDRAPPGVAVNGDIGSLWSDIPEAPDASDEDDHHA